MAPRHPLVYTALSAASFAAMALFTRIATRNLPGEEVAFLRFVLMLAPFLFLPRLARQAVTFERLDLLLYRGLFGGVAVLLYFLAIEHVPVGTATLLNYSSPIWSVLFAALFLGERVRPVVLLPAPSPSAASPLVTGGLRGRRPVLRPWPLGARRLRLVGAVGRRRGGDPRGTPHRELVGDLRQLHALRPPRDGAVRARAMARAERGATGSGSSVIGVSSIAAQLLDDLRLPLGDQRAVGRLLAGDGRSRLRPGRRLPRRTVRSGADRRQPAHSRRCCRRHPDPVDAEGGGVGHRGLAVATAGAAAGQLRFSLPRSIFPEVGARQVLDQVDGARRLVRLELAGDEVGELALQALAAAEGFADDHPGVWLDAGRSTSTTPTTAHSTTAGWRSRQPSTSAGENHLPATLRTSSPRPW